MSISSTEESDYRTYVTNITLNGKKSRIITKTAVTTLTIGFPTSTLDAIFWSYAGIAADSNGLLYFSNELSDQEIFDTSGNMYVSEDSSGLIIQLTPPFQIWLPLIIW